ncbi:MAG TPA: BTAD domain-containing putative transcriptional regulator, partial [Ktedonobacterales bacterium]
RVLFRRLAIFAGSFSLDTAEAICGGEGIEPANVLDVLSRLVDKSLVTVSEQAGDTRYRLLETLRQYGLDKLREANEYVAVFGRYRDWFLALAEHSEELKVTGQGNWVVRFEAGHDDLRALLRESVAAHAFGTAARLCGSLWSFWIIRGYLGEGRRWLETVLAEDLEPPLVRFQALLALGAITTHLGEYDHAAEIFQQGLDIALAQHDDLAAGDILYGIANLLQIRGDYARSVREYEASLVHCRAVRNARSTGLSLNGLGLTRLYLGDLAGAASSCEESLAMFQETGDQRSLAGALTNLGMIAIEQGAYATAQLRCEQSLAIRRVLGDRGGMAHTETFLGRIACELGDLLAAAAHYHAALVLRHQTGEREGMLAPLEGFAHIASARGDPHRAARLLGATVVLRRQLGAPLPPNGRSFNERTLSAVRNQLTVEALQHEWAAGEAFTFERAIEEAQHVIVAAPLMADEPAAVAAVPARERVSLAPVDIVGFVAARIVRDGHELTASDWTYAKARELLFFLLMCGPSTKEQIGLALWPDASAAQLRRAFHPTLHHLRRALGGATWVVLAQQRYAISRTLPFTFDVAQFSAELTQAKQCAAADPAAAITLLAGATARYRGRFLAGLTEGEWYLTFQDQLHDDFLAALQQLGALLFAAGRYAEAASAYKHVIAEDLYLDGAHRELMRCYARMGEPGQALRHYQALAASWQEAFGTLPTLETRALYARLRRGEDIS